MAETKPKLEQVLHELQKSDGDKWIRILAQDHHQYQEIPFWVLVEGREQIPNAISFLQEKLRPLQEGSQSDVTVSFVSYHGDKEHSHGMFKGEEFFSRNAVDDLYEEPFENPRVESVFDVAYPHDHWALRKDS